MDVHECDNCGEFIPVNWKCECTLPPAPEKLETGKRLGDVEAALLYVKQKTMSSKVDKYSEMREHFLAGCQKVRSEMRGEIERLKAKLADVQEMNRFRIGQGVELSSCEARLSAALASKAAAVGALEKIRDAKCPSYMAHPQSVWWSEHVQSIAVKALAQLKEKK